MAYAALSSLMQTLQHLLQAKSPLNSCASCIQQQHVESSYQSLCDLQVFLEDTTNEANDIENLNVLEKKIRDVVYKAEDRVDSSLRSIILADIEDDQEKACKFFNEELQQVEIEFASLRKEVMVIELNKRGSKSTELAKTSSSISTEETTFVGMKDDYEAILNCLNAQTKELIVISLVGMGGIGKTTLARKVFDNSIIRDRYDKHAWVTISEQYNKRQMLLEVASSITGINNQEMSNDELMVIVHRGLKGRRFLIVIDDLWNTEAWDQMRRIFQNDNNKSRIILTTRLKDVADYASCRDFPPRDVSFLSLDDSWKLFTERLLRKDPCPPQLEEIGKHIVRKCQGLPLSIVVVAGILGKMDPTHDNWKKVEGNLNSFFGTVSEQCQVILSLSYSYLPHYLKSCFLYVGGFPEDTEIVISKLIRLWIAEQFVNSRSDKSLEVVAKEYLQDLIDRSLILVGTRKANGSMKTCKIHDLLRHLCIREAQIENCLQVINYNVDNSKEDIINYQRRVMLLLNIDMRHVYLPEHGSGITNTTRSFVVMRNPNEVRVMCPITSCFKLLKVLDVYSIDYDFSCVIPQLVHLIYVAANIKEAPSVARLWNLQTIILDTLAGWIYLPLEIWTMSNVRHLEIGLAIVMANPVEAESHNSIGEQPESLYLNNLQTLSLDSSPFLAEILKRTPNVDKLKIRSVNLHNEWSSLLDCLILLQRLENLSMRAIAENGPLILPSAFCAPNLKKLRLNWTNLAWEDMLVLANLPNLEVLKTEGAFNGTKWILNEHVVFQKLKYLRFELEHLESWEASSDNFLVLEQLILIDINELDEIPESIGEIATLKLIQIENCSSTTITSATKIQEEQESLGNYELQIRIIGEELKHVDIEQIDMPNPLSIGEQPESLYLNNLQTLSLDSSPFWAEILLRTPNIDKLKIRAANTHNEWSDFVYCLIKLQRLEKLSITATKDNSPRILSSAFCAPNLKHLRLAETSLPWEDMAVLANLPNLEVLKADCAFTGTDWDLNEDVVFQKLKYLRIMRADDLEMWEAASDSFPMLEQLVLQHLEELEDIPQSFGEIMTLKLVQVKYCSPTVDDSARNILEDQQSWGNCELQIIIVRSPIEVVAEEYLQDLTDTSLMLAGTVQRANSHFKLLKVLDVSSCYCDCDCSCVIPHLVVLRHVSARIGEAPSLAKLWNLQTIILDTYRIRTYLHLPPDMWTMAKIRHLDIGLSIHMSNPLEEESREQQSLFLNNLKTLALPSCLISSCSKQKMHSGEQITNSCNLGIKTL